MFGPVDNRIAPEDRLRAYAILGFVGRGGTHSIPESLELSAMLDTARLTELHARAREEHGRRIGRGGLRGLIEYRVGVELAAERSVFGLTEVRRGRPNHGGREVDLTRTIIGTIHTHPWDVAQSIGDVRNLLRTNDVLGGVVTHTGRMFLLIKHPDAPEGDRSPFAGELALQRASLREAPGIVGSLGVVGALSAAFDLPIRATRDPYIRAVCGRLGLVGYAGDVARPTLRRA
jgi:hypothetical protein